MRDYGTRSRHCVRTGERMFRRLAALKALLRDGAELPPDSDVEPDDGNGGDNGGQGGVRLGLRNGRSGRLRRFCGRFGG